MSSAQTTTATLYNSSDFPYDSVVKNANLIPLHLGIKVIEKGRNRQEAAIANIDKTKIKSLIIKGNLADSINKRNFMPMFFELIENQLGIAKEKCSYIPKDCDADNDIIEYSKQKARESKTQNQFALAG